MSLLTIEWFKCHNGQWEDILLLQCTHFPTLHSLILFMPNFAKMDFCSYWLWHLWNSFQTSQKTNIYFCNSWSRGIFLVIMMLPMGTSWSLLGPRVEVGLTPPFQLLGHFFSFYYQVNWMCIGHNQEGKKQHFISKPF